MMETENNIKDHIREVCITFYNLPLLPSYHSTIYILPEKLENAKYFFE